MFEFKTTTQTQPQQSEDYVQVDWKAMQKETVEITALQKP